MKSTHLVERKKKAYNEAMRQRTQVNHSAGKEPKNYKTPQVRPLPMSTEQRVSEPFEKKSNFNKELVSKPVSSEEYVRINKHGTLILIHPKLRRKHTRRVNKTVCKQPLRISRRQKHAISN